MVKKTSWSQYVRLCLIPLGWVILGCSTPATDNFNPPLMYLPNKHTNTIANPQEHESDLTQATALIRQDSSVAGAYSKRAILYTEIGRLSDAIDDLLIGINILHSGSSIDSDQLSRLSVQLSKVYVKRGIANWYSKETDKAIADYTEAIRFDPENWTALFHRWQTYRFLTDEAKAEKDCQRGMTLQPEVFKRKYAFGLGVI